MPGALKWEAPHSLGLEGLVEDKRIRSQQHGHLHPTCFGAAARQKQEGMFLGTSRQEPQPFAHPHGSSQESINSSSASGIVIDHHTIS